MKNEVEPKINTPGIIVLQWLTYAFWGLTIFAASLLSASVIAYFMNPTNNNDFSAYATAAVLVLLPISVICDIFYSKQEPEHKTGAASIIMIIYAVLFALFGIGALIAIVFSLVQLMISSSDITNTQIALYSEMIVVVLYAVTFLRTLLPAKLVKFRRLYIVFMIIIAGIISTLSFIGPVTNAQLTRDDRLIDNNLNYIQSGIDTYSHTQNKLPENLSVISVTGDAKKIVDNKLVKYTPNSKTPLVTQGTFNPSTSTTTYYYELCVNYKSAASDSESTYTPVQTDSRDGYNSYIITFNHPAGDYCYKVSTSTDFLSK